MMAEYLPSGPAGQDPHCWCPTRRDTHFTLRTWGRCTFPSPVSEHITFHNWVQECTGLAGRSLDSWLKKREKSGLPGILVPFTHSKISCWKSEQCLPGYGGVGVLPEECTWLVEMCAPVPQRWAWSTRTCQDQLVGNWHESAWCRSAGPHLGPGYPHEDMHHWWC